MILHMLHETHSLWPNLCRSGTCSLPPQGCASLRLLLRSLLYFTCLDLAQVLTIWSLKVCPRVLLTKEHLNGDLRSKRFDSCMRTYLTMTSRRNVGHHKRGGFNRSSYGTHPYWSASEGVALLAVAHPCFLRLLLYCHLWDLALYSRALDLPQPWHPSYDKEGLLKL